MLESKVAETLHSSSSAAPGRRPSANSCAGIALAYLSAIFLAASGAVHAQATTPAAKMKEKQETVDSVTRAVQDPQSVSKQQARNVEASKNVEPMSASEKNRAFRNLNASTINPNDPSGTSGTTALQKANVAKSDAMNKQVPNMNTPAASEAMRKASTP